MPSKKDVGDIEEWKQIVRDAKVRICDSQPVYLNGKPKMAGVLPPVNSYYLHYTGGPNDQSGPGWNGWGINGLDTNYPLSITSAMGYWHVPTLQSPGHFNDDAAVWVGVGGLRGTPGSGAHELVQSGTDSETINGLVYYYTWVENTGTPGNFGENHIDLGVQNGHLIYAHDGSATTASNDMFVQDQTNGRYYDRSDGPTADTTASECIVERPDGPGGGIFGQQALANFGTVDFQACRAHVGGALFGIGNVTNPTLWPTLYQETSTGDSGGNPCALSSGFVDANNSTFNTYYNNGGSGC